MSRGAIAYIDTQAIRHNYARIKTLANGANVLAIIKSNAYGHGLVRVASALQCADGFGVASVDEAVALRNAGIKQRIVVMAGFYDQDELAQFSQHDLDIVVHRLDQVRALESDFTSKTLNVWLKIDTGMNRLGFAANDVVAVYERLQHCSLVNHPIILMTHLADADNHDSTFTQQQLARFNAITAGLSGPRSIVNSAGLLNYGELAAADWVRPGGMLYGVSPIAERAGKEHGLKPAMTLVAKLMAIKHVQKNQVVGYGGAWVCPQDMTIGIVGIGYGDGYPRHAQNGTPTLVNGKICPLIGRVSMDMIAIDLRSQSQAAIGDTVILWGEGLPVEKVAHSAGTIGYELLCNVTPRVRFIQYDNDQHTRAGQDSLALRAPRYARAR